MAVDGRTKAGLQRRVKTRARIIAAAFEIFGEQYGLFARIEDVVKKAGVTRATFYNHFAGIVELHEALVSEVTHDFMLAVSEAAERIPDIREGSAVAVRLYLHRARNDPRWAWSMLSISASGCPFGQDTQRRAEQTLKDGIEKGFFPISSAPIGRDILLGSMLAAVSSMLTEQVPGDYPEEIASHILCALGVPINEARAIASRPLPVLNLPI